MFKQAFKNIDDVLWKEAGCTTELDYTEQTSWLLFLKYLEGLEADKATEDTSGSGERPGSTRSIWAGTPAVCGIRRQRRVFRPSQNASAPCATICTSWTSAPAPMSNSCRSLRMARWHSDLVGKPAFAF